MVSRNKRQHHLLCVSRVSHLGMPNMNNAKTKLRLLIVSPGTTDLRPYFSAGERNHWEMNIAGDISEAMDVLRDGGAFDLFLFLIPQGHAESLDSLRWTRRLRPNLPMIVVDHEDNRGRRRQTTLLGVREYLVSPLSETELEETIRRLLPVHPDANLANITSDEVEQIDKERFFVGLTPAMRRLRAQAEMLAEADMFVFISGERGSGRETVARLLHRLSVRSGFLFGRVDCAALPEDLLELEIFGELGRDACGSPIVRRGKLEQCASGRIFLDEVTEMPLRLQGKLAQALQGREFVRPGSSERVGIDVLVVASSSTTMDEAVAQYRLHPDLCRCFRGCELSVPPLRERREEIPFLSRHLMHQFARNYRLSPRELAPATAEVWQSYAWPGNLRELAEAVKRYLVAGDQVTVAPEFPAEVEHREACSTVSERGTKSRVGPPCAGVGGYESLRSLLRRVREEAEKSAIATALQETGWNRKAAARLLRISYRSVLYKIEQYQMTSSDRPALDGFSSRKARVNGVSKRSVSGPDLGRAGNGVR